MDEYDFGGWATRNDLRCSDGRIIRKDAFKTNDGQIVPLVWNHQHNDPLNVLGHALLENRDDGVYAYCKFNDTASGTDAKELVKHGDVTALSIYANKLKQQGGNVLHGAIREVSLVLAGANPGAFIDSILSHDDSNDEEAIIYTGEEIALKHAEKEPVIEEKPKEKEITKTMAKDVAANENEETIQDVFDTLDEKQKKVVYFLIGKAVEDAKNEGTDDEGDEEDMKHNVFDNDEETNYGDVLSHSDMEAIISDTKRYGSMKDSALAHGITNIDYLFPDAETITNVPNLITRDMTWVHELMNGFHHTPFSRIKSVQANITEDDARAKGYIKGNLKKDEVFSLLKRVTSPTTVYKKQKLDRDDVVDITDFDVVGFLKSEMRTMLDEEIARAALVGDGRITSSDDKINEQNIRPIWTDADLYTIKATVSLSPTATDDDTAKAFIRAVIKARKDYKGSGNPALYTTEEILSSCLLLTDTTGRDLYSDESQLAKKLRVGKILTVPVMENRTRTDATDSKVHTLMGIVVNPADYNIGADKGGAVNLFDDFDIDYNAQKYLIETRCSGALTIPYSAIAVESVPTAA